MTQFNTPTGGLGGFLARFLTGLTGGLDRQLQQRQRREQVLRSEQGKNRRVLEDLGIKFGVSPDFQVDVPGMAEPPLPGEERGEVLPSTEQQTIPKSSRSLKREIAGKVESDRDLARRQAENLMARRDATTKENTPDGRFAASASATAGKEIGQASAELGLPITGLTPSEIEDQWISQGLNLRMEGALDKSILSTVDELAKQGGISKTFLVKFRGAKSATERAAVLGEGWNDLLTSNRAISEKLAIRAETRQLLQAKELAKYRDSLARERLQLQDDLKKKAKTDQVRVSNVETMSREFGKLIHLGRMADELEATAGVTEGQIFGSVGAAGALLDVLGGFSGISEGGADVNSKLAALKTTVTEMLSGKAVTDSEWARLRDLMPSKWLGDKVFFSRLDMVQEYLAGIALGRLDAYESAGALTSETAAEWRKMMNLPATTSDIYLEGLESGRQNAMELLLPTEAGRAGIDAGLEGVLNTIDAQ